MNEVTINGTVFVPKEDSAATKDGKQYVIIRSGDAGVFAGYLADRDGDTVQLLEARRLWHWSGAATLSQLAIDGVSNPDNCKFPEELPTTTVFGVCEIIPTSEKARKSINEVKVWRA